MKTESTKDSAQIKNKKKSKGLKVEYVQMKKNTRRMLHSFRS